MAMSGLRGWIIFAWIALPTVMYGGYSLLQLIKRGNVLTPAQVNFFRAGHAHAGVLTLMSLLYYMFIAVLHVFRSNVALPASQARSVRGHGGRHPRTIGRLFYSPLPGTRFPGYQSNSDGRCHFGRCHRRLDLWLAQRILKANALRKDARSRMGSAIRLQRGTAAKGHKPSGLQ
jgi:hypothetical protein